MEVEQGGWVRHVGKLEYRSGLVGAKKKLVAKKCGGANEEKKGMIGSLRWVFCAALDFREVWQRMVKQRRRLGSEGWGDALCGEGCPCRSSQTPFLRLHKSAIPLHFITCQYHLPLIRALTPSWQTSEQGKMDGYSRAQARLYSWLDLEPRHWNHSDIIGSSVVHLVPAWLATLSIDLPSTRSLCKGNRPRQVRQSSLPDGWWGRSVAGGETDADVSDMFRSCIDRFRIICGAEFEVAAMRGHIGARWR